VLSLRDFPFWRGRGWGERQVYAGVGPLFLGMFSLTTLVNADIVGLKLAGPADSSDLLAGHYQAAVTLARIPIFLTLALFNAVFPFVAQHAGRSALANAYASLALKYTLLFIVPIDVAFVAIPGPVLGFFYPAAYAVSAGPLALAALGTILLTLVHACAMLLQAAHRARLPALALVLAVALEGVALAALVPRLGTSGAPLALIVAGLFGLVLLLPGTLRVFHLHLSPAQAAGYLVALATFGLLLRLLPHGGRVGLVAATTVAGLAYLALLVLLGLITPHDVEKLGDGLGPRLGGVPRSLGRLVERCNLVRP
jgi:O-antigen/teichoic acid export membrane protein